MSILCSLAGQYYYSAEQAELSKVRLKLPPQIFWRREAGEHVLHCDGNLKRFVIPTAFAEMLSCKLLSTAAAFVLNMM